MFSFLSSTSQQSLYQRIIKGLKFGSTMRVSVADAQGEATSVHGRSIKDVTPSDTVDLSIPGYLMIDNNGADGDIAFIPFDNVDSEVILLSYAKGDDPKPYLVRRVMATSTTATGIKVVY